MRLRKMFPLFRTEMFWVPIGAMVLVWYNLFGFVILCTSFGSDSPSNSSSDGKRKMQIMAAFAEFERNIISERTKEALKGNP